VPYATASTGEVMPHEETESAAAPLTWKRVRVRVRLRARVRVRVRVRDRVRVRY
jgi:hypothetical protein